MTNLNPPKPEGFIVISMFPESGDGEIIQLGGAGWSTQEELYQQWLAVPDHQSEAQQYTADLHDKDGSLIGTKTVDQEFIERRLGQPIDELIATGKAKLEQELQGA